MTMSASGQIRVVQIFISPGHNFYGHKGKSPGEHPTHEVKQVECVAGKGLRGDRFFDFKEDSISQVSFISQDAFDKVCRELGVMGKNAGVTRRNVVIRGVELSTLVGKEFEVQGIRFLGTEECRPCLWMNHAVAPGAEAALCGCGGLRAKILTDGILRVD